MNWWMWLLVAGGAVLIALVYGLLILGSRDDDLFDRDEPDGGAHSDARNDTWVGPDAMRWTPDKAGDR